MIIVFEVKIEAWTLEPSIEFVIARVKVVKLYPLCQQLSLNIVSQWNWVIPGLVLQLIYIVISYILIGCPCDSVMVLHESEEAWVVEASLCQLCQVRVQVLQLEHIHGVESVGVGGDRRKFSHVALAVAAGREITIPETILVDLLHGEKVISEDCQVDLFVADFLSNGGQIVAHSRMLNIKVSLLGLKEAKDITDEAKSVFSIPVSEIKTPCYHYIIKLIWVSDILHALNELLSKSSIQMKLFHEVSSHRRGVQRIPIESHRYPTWNNICIVHQMSEEAWSCRGFRAIWTLENRLPIKDHRLILDSL